jgi:uncharacterized iron-regulated membrane protein
VRPVLLFRGGLAGKARDFNWHNVIGFWCLAPLFFIVLSGVVMSYPWANSLLYKLSSSELPVQGQRPGGRGPAAELNLDGINTIWARAEQQVAGWQSISLRLPASARAPLTFSIDEGNGGQPSKRSQLTLSRQSAEVIRWETFGDYNLGRRLRSYIRFEHTGEIGGIGGQTIAGVASAGGAVLVWTGLALAWRRLRAWLGRRRNAKVIRETAMRPKVRPGTPGVSSHVSTSSGE